jgi:hypothetical protein
MRKTLTALGAGLAVLAGAAALGGAAHAQPYGYYRGYGDYAYRYAPPVIYGYDGRYTPYAFYNGYDYAGIAVGGAQLGSTMGYVYAPGTPYDRYGPDPNGMMAPDGHRIKCKLTTFYDGLYGRYVTRRECW